MQQIVIMTALTVTSGLFGGGRHHGASGHWGRTPAYAAPACSGQAPCAASPQVYAPTPAPAPVAPAPQAVYYQANYYAPAPAPCPTGTCPRR